VRTEESVTELGWLRLIFGFVFWIAFVLLLVWVWDTTGNAIARIQTSVVEGIPLREGSKLVPSEILTGIGVFVALLLFTAWFKASLSKHWLREVGLDRGARDAVTTLVGYAGVIIAAIIGMVVAGVNFKGLAIVAGALSVGIGFGLQNVVNNFVSGLILLFERPIKAGDFVSVGLIEGKVRRIRIRSTEIETLDRQNVIVPNSELVSTQVTNWVLHDNIGRLRVLFGVAYGSDTQKVKEIVEQVAREHPEVMTQGRAPEPLCLFMAFGESSLDFELRVWIRHIENRFEVTSDLNFAIDQAFRDNGIEIPFPQRDLHIRSGLDSLDPDSKASTPASD
ncbi:MAG: mechanosensitive ion channel family protein, partial [Gammaproteobacteria bacterium]|nr:mechanosensitive ion channel family protein [Gammaproteobacteria bacterium]